MGGVREGVAGPPLRFGELVSDIFIYFQVFSEGAPKISKMYVDVICVTSNLQIRREHEKQPLDTDF